MAGSCGELLPRSGALRLLHALLQAIEVLANVCCFGRRVGESDGAIESNAGFVAPIELH